jgi:hypothetical protein
MTPTHARKGGRLYRYYVAAGLMVVGMFLLVAAARRGGDFVAEPLVPDA